MRLPLPEMPILLSSDPAERMHFLTEQLNELDAQRNRVATELLIAQAELTGLRSAGVATGALLTIPQVCERLKLGKSKVYQLMADGILPRISLEGSDSARVEARAVDEYLARSRARAERGGGA